MKPAEPKSRKRRLIVYEWGFWIPLSIGGIMFFVNHKFAIASIPVLFVGLIIGAFALRLSLINNGSTQRIATRWWWVIAISGTVFCGALFLAEMSPIGNESPQPLPVSSAGWQPPELPPGCSNITVWFGTLRVDMPRWVSEMEHDESSAKLNGTNSFRETIKPNLSLLAYDSPNDTNNSGTMFAVKDLPDFFKKDERKLPEYSPRHRHIKMVSQSLEVYGGGTTNESPIWPFVISNRLFVDVMIPFINQRHRILMDTNLDVALTNLPQKWDINYDSNKLKIVNEDTNPVLQVVYKSPSEVKVNGIYIVDEYTVYEAFDGFPNLLSYEMTFGSQGSTQEFVMPIKQFAQTFKNVIVSMNTNEIFRGKYPNQKVIFKYPSADYLGEEAK